MLLALALFESLMAAKHMPNSFLVFIIRGYAIGGM
jgi:hypothetical protein